MVLRPREGEPKPREKTPVGTVCWKDTTADREDQMIATTQGGATPAEGGPTHPEGDHPRAGRRRSNLARRAQHGGERRHTTRRRETRMDGETRLMKKHTLLLTSRGRSGEEGPTQEIWGETHHGARGH